MADWTLILRHSPTLPATERSVAVRHRLFGSLPPISSRWSRPRKNTAIVRSVFAGAMVTIDALTILAMSILTVLLYAPGLDAHQPVWFGAATGTFFVVANLLRGGYAFTRYLSFKGHLKKSILIWTTATISTLTLAFVTKTSDDYSRGATVLLFFLGYGGLVVLRIVLVHIARCSAEAGWIAGRNVFLVGDEAMIRTFLARHDTHQAGLRLVGAWVLRPNPESLRDDLVLAAAAARVCRPDDVHILVPWNDRAMLEGCVHTFLSVPASIHLSPETFLDDFADLDVVRNGSITSIHLVRSPLSTSHFLAKRAFDITVATLAIALLSPLFLLVAVAISTDSKGSVFFRQRRYGFNQEVFTILKFRSLYTTEVDSNLRQVMLRDDRVTRVGRLLRRTNIDELPQLINVLRGDMSLVGPRPHALVHDQTFEREIALYARRHNVRPGITGWAQVNGWRGETDTPEKFALVSSMTSTTSTIGRCCST